ncbi:MAG: hypothetical protein AB7G13_15475 [Lautropia sp.]
MAWLNLLQWPAMVVTLTAAWLVSADTERSRNWGFWLYLASNVLWIAWGWHSGSWALILLQIGLAVMNVRGARNSGE